MEAAPGSVGQPRGGLCVPTVRVLTLTHSLACTHNIPLAALLWVAIGELGANRTLLAEPETTEFRRLAARQLVEVRHIDRDRLLASADVLEESAILR